MSWAIRSSDNGLSAVEKDQKLVISCGGMASIRAIVDRLEALQVSGS